MEIPHPHLPKVTWVVLVEIGPVVMLAACHTAAAGVFSVFAYAAVSGGDVAATICGEKG